ncbi:hypothetical protein GCM10010329_80940 [Streptomyces spiroverticillatus]|uniref:Uncharacterized protein n=1 Tax=Streptomyces finlayi TaxID=67296 RepID=A0A918X7Z5_9ACTN|nr:hypothetical protein [Streptomyces finlayi]GHA46110.1 hypothetical protein GCM10010329_80940 [Streptomyces spiroverticillatus]GHD16123.1 hypothetical protein GCM10010334_76860 [Streptomyces finlayi]
MSRYRITYAPPADATLAKMTGAEIFRAAVAATIGTDPYGHGSTPVRGDRDRREATVHQAFLRYVISPSVLTVTVVRLITID